MLSLVLANFGLQLFDVLGRPLISVLEHVRVLILPIFAFTVLGLEHRLVFAEELVLRACVSSTWQSQLLLSQALLTPFFAFCGPHLQQYLVLLQLRLCIWLPCTYILVILLQSLPVLFCLQRLHLVKLS